MAEMKNKQNLLRFGLDNLGDVKNWEHKGEVVELQTVSGTCVCGHPIKFLYYIEEKTHTKKKLLEVNVFNNFKDYSPEMYEALNELTKTYKENKKKRKR